ncbi:MAG TPA: MarR family winged helix-turn-helix transcriptional regulator, partial [Steroidobacteraceae bacterium]|nr:MarR family winged helix-turn-helix transcriptional regulator [Steroidobacteraceae bacterium]
MMFRTLVLLGRALAQLADEAIRPSGLGEAEFRVLMLLYSQPDGVAHPGELCPGSGQSPANMSRITDTLVALDMI